MGNSLTTHELIRKIELGQVAKLVTGNHPTYYGVKRFVDGIYWVKEDKEMFKGDILKITNWVLEKARWKLLPKYVPVHEAIKAYMEGKTIACHMPSGDKYTYTKGLDKNSISRPNTSILLNEIEKGKWVIEDE